MEAIGEEVFRYLSNWKAFENEEDIRSPNIDQGKM